MNRRHMTFVASLFTLLFLFIAVISDAAADSLTIPNRQPWSHIPGPCAGLDGAVFAVVGTGCGGTGTSFDTAEIFSPVVIKDVATAAAPCDAISAPLTEPVIAFGMLVRLQPGKHPVSVMLNHQMVSTGLVYPATHPL
ncbi:MAG: hypothetical protein IPL78_32660 [Chloroflexi bacterium]|nr:hypothetical protein [Chloroflexota bacterium]